MNTSPGNTPFPFTFLNGKVVPLAEARVSVLDRGFMYGDGLFETLPIFNGKPLLLADHLERLWQSAELLALPIPLSKQALTVAVETLIDANDAREAVLRLTLTRGIGDRGYHPPNHIEPTLIAVLHPLDNSRIKQLNEGIRLEISEQLRDESSVLSRVKSLNALPQIIARMDIAGRSGEETLLLNHQGRVACASAANVFGFRNDTLITPPISEGALPGITRAQILKLSVSCGIQAAEEPIELGDLVPAKEVFLTNSVAGVMPVLTLTSKLPKPGFERPVSFLTTPVGIARRLQNAYWNLVAEETGVSPFSVSGKTSSYR